MHRFVDKEVWLLKFIKHDDKVFKKQVIVKRLCLTLFIPEFDLDLKMEKVFSKSYEENFVCVHAKEKISKFCLLQNNF